MPKFPLDLDTLIVTTFETSAPVSDQACDALLVNRTVLCRPSQNWTCTI